MSNKAPVRVFIGSGEASVLERKTLIYSLRKHCSRELDIYVFNGTHNAIEHNDEPPVLANMSLNVKYRNYTEFSNYRFLIPEICGHEGRAIFLDSDMVCLGDIATFYDLPMEDNAMLAKPEAYQGDSCWGMSQILFDCSKCHFDLEKIFSEIDAGEYTNADLHQMKPDFLKKYPYKLGSYDATWNVFDQCDASTNLVHFTNLGTQPWKFPGHPFEHVWFKYFNEARKAGVITGQDLKKTLSRAYARQDILNPAKIADDKSARKSASPATLPMVAASSKEPHVFKKLERKFRKFWRGEKKAG